MPAAQGIFRPSFNRKDAHGHIAFIILGLLAGLIAKAIMPGNDPGGYIVTTLIGIAGALIGGFLAAALLTPTRWTNSSISRRG